MECHRCRLIAPEQCDVAVIEQDIIPAAVHVESAGLPRPGELRIAAAAKIIRIGIVDWMMRIHSKWLGIAAALRFIAAEDEAPVDEVLGNV